MGHEYLKKLLSAVILAPSKWTSENIRHGAASVIKNHRHRAKALELKNHAKTLDVRKNMRSESGVPV
jgi:hypothetical protein